MREGFGSQLAPQIGAARTGLDGGQHAVVVIRIGDGPNAVMVLGGGANHGRPADVDVLDDLLAVVGTCKRRREWVQVHGDEVDGCQAVLGKLFAMGCEVASGQEAGVNRRVQRLHATVEHLGPARHRVDRLRRNAGGVQRLRRARRGHDLPAKGVQAGGQPLDAALVVYGQQRAWCAHAVVTGGSTRAMPSTTRTRPSANHCSTSG